jgi:transposase InsO family protein
VAATSLPTSPAQRRGAAKQQPQREHENSLRRRAAHVGLGLFDLGWWWDDIAALFRVAERTLRHWRQTLLGRFAEAHPLGRPRERSSREARNEVIHFLDEFGPGVGVPALRKCFPVMSRAELQEILGRYRHVWRERNRVPLRVLTWPAPGRVWAIDYAEAPSPVEGLFPYLLAVRDLSSGMQLLWRPQPAATADAAAGELTSLFAEHGTPLVLKSDNGSHFAGGAVQRLLHGQGVEWLPSPPGCPRYNGSIEAGIGSMKERTGAHAALAGRAGHWTWDDTAGALAEANALARPRGECGPSPEAIWGQRSAITHSERAAFRVRVEVERNREKERASACGESPQGVWSEREAARRAVRRALEECGYLLYQRRRILPPIPRPKVASIT